MGRRSTDRRSAPAIRCLPGRHSGQAESTEDYAGPVWSSRPVETRFIEIGNAPKWPDSADARPSGLRICPDAASQARRADLPSARQGRRQAGRHMTDISLSDLRHGAVRHIVPMYRFDTSVR